MSARANRERAAWQARRAYAEALTANERAQTYIDGLTRLAELNLSADRVQMIRDGLSDLVADTFAVHLEECDHEQKQY